MINLISFLKLSINKTSFLFGSSRNNTFYISILYLLLCYMSLYLIIIIFLKNWSLHIYVPVKYINILVSDIDAWSKLKYQYFVAKHILHIMTWGKKIRWYFCKYWKKKGKASEIKETLIFHNILQLGPSFLSYWQITGC